MSTILCKNSGAGFSGDRHSDGEGSCRAGADFDDVTGVRKFVGLFGADGNRMRPGRDKREKTLRAGERHFRDLIEDDGYAAIELSSVGNSHLHTAGLCSIGLGFHGGHEVGKAGLEFDQPCFGFLLDLGMYEVDEVFQLLEHSLKFVRGRNLVFDFRDEGGPVIPKIGEGSFKRELGFDIACPTGGEAVELVHAQNDNGQGKSEVTPLGVE